MSSIPHKADATEHNGREPQSHSEASGDSSSTQSDSLRRLRKKYRALLEGAPDAVFVAESETGEVIEANQAAASLLETTVEDIVGRHQSWLHPSDDCEQYRTLFEQHKAAASDGVEIRGELEDGTPIYVETVNGEKIPVEISASFVDLNGESLFVGIFRDVSDRRRREEALKEAKQEAEAANRLKDAMLMNISHEIRTPITSIIGFSKVLTQVLEGKPEEHAEHIYRAGQNLMKTVNDVLELAKLEAEAREIELKPVPVDRAVEWAVDLHRSAAEENDVELVVEIPEARVEALGNLEALNYIVEQLLENAVKFTPEGGRVEVRLHEESSAAILEVRDTGVGMDPGAVEDLFEPFRQASEGVAREYSGIGLGLAIVKQLSDVIGAEIEVETEKGEGSRFAIRVPRPDEGGED